MARQRRLPEDEQTTVGTDEALVGAYAPTDVRQAIERGGISNAAAARLIQRATAEDDRARLLEQRHPAMKALDLVTREQAAAFEELAGSDHADARKRTRSRRNTIVDDPRDPKNGAAAGTGRGLLQEGGTGWVSEQHEFGPLHDGAATSMKGMLLPDVDALEQGSEPKGGTWPPWWARHRPKRADHWVRGHLLNHNLGGPGEPRNLTPITKKCNSEHHNLVERLCKDAAERDCVLGYEVEAIYDSSGPELTDDRDKDPARAAWPRITTGFQCRWQFHGGEDASEGGAGTLFVENRH